MLIDINTARSAELRPYRQYVAILIEDLDAVIPAIADEQAALGIHRERMWRLELARRAAVHAPLLDELAVWIQFDDASIAFARFVTVGDEDIAVRRHHYGIRFMKGIGPIAGYAGFPQCPQQLSIAIELQHVIAF